MPKGGGTIQSNAILPATVLIVKDPVPANPDQE